MTVKQTFDWLIGLPTALRSMGERPVLIACTGLALVLLLLARLDVKPVHTAADMLGHHMVPLVTVVREPVSWSRQLGQEVGGFFAVRSENARLREQNRQLLEWQAQAVRLGIENRSLRTMLDMPPPEQLGDWVNARIVADSAGPFVHTRLIDAGEAAGITSGMAVMTPQGMIGRVIAVGERSSRILLVTDFNSKIPVIVERSGDQALLVGDNTSEPKLEFLPLNPQFRVGDKLVTSGRGGVLPSGLTVGEISRIEEARVAVRPVAWDGLDYVAVLRHTPLAMPDNAADERAGTLVAGS